jgi:hypothetical protein
MLFISRKTYQTGPYVIVTSLGGFYKVVCYSLWKNTSPLIKDGQNMGVQSSCLHICLIWIHLTFPWSQNIFISSKINILQFLVWTTVKWNFLDNLWITLYCVLLPHALFSKLLVQRCCTVSLHGSWEVASDLSRTTHQYCKLHLTMVHMNEF